MLEKKYKTEQVNDNMLTKNQIDGTTLSEYFHVYPKYEDSRHCEAKIHRPFDLYCAQQSVTAFFPE